MRLIFKLAHTICVRVQVIQTKFEHFFGAFRALKKILFVSVEKLGYEIKTTRKA